jgi:hypothetical protein
MGTSRDIASALNFKSGLIPLAQDEAMDDDMSDMGMTGDPPTSEAQRKAMWAAKSGNSTLGIPKSVGAEFANADPGGKLPKQAKDEFAPDKLYGVQTPSGNGDEDNAVSVHDKLTDYEPKKGRWGGRAGHSTTTRTSYSAADAAGLETEKAENNESGTGHGEMPKGRYGGRASPHLRSGQGMDS